MTDENTSLPTDLPNPAEEFKDIPVIESAHSAETTARPKKRRWRRSHAIFALSMMAIYLIGLSTGYGLWGLPTPAEKAAHLQDNEMAEIMGQVNPAEGYTVPANFGDMGPKMAAAGVFDAAEFEQVFQLAKQPLNEQQLEILNQGSDSLVVFNQQNAYFLLNYFWAVGLSNKNPILDSGPIQEISKGKVENFASTGGWSLAKKPLAEIYSMLPLTTLTAEQQKNLEEAAQAVYRPCCDNPTHFPDCNHGMAMLGLMELMASQNATVEQMLETARYSNAYWYPAQTVEQAIFFKNTTGGNFQDIDARTLLGPRYSSGSGFQGLHQFLTENNLLPQAPQNNNSCGV
jgi:hypothetical protein